MGHYQPGMKFLAVFTLLGTCFTFMPDGIGFFASVVPTLQGNLLWEAVGVLCIATSIKAIYNAWKMAKRADGSRSASNVVNLADPTPND